MKYEFEDKDEWDLFTELAKVNKAGLELFKKNNTGIPPMDPEDCKGFKAEEDPMDSDYVYSDEAWEHALDEMIYAFEKLAKDEVIYTEEQEERITKGLQFFGKYFRNLWI